MILPAIEVQPGIQAVGKQGTAVGTGTAEDTFSATFGESLRETASVQSVQAGTEDQPKVSGDTGKAVSGQAVDGSATGGLAAKIRSRVAEATSEVARQSADQASAGTQVAAAKSSATPLKGAIADATELSAGVGNREIQVGRSLTTDLKTVVARTAGADAKADSGAKSNLVRAGLARESEELAATETEVGGVDGARARVAATGARAVPSGSNAASVAAGKSKEAAAAETESTLGLSVAPGVTAAAEGAATVSAPDFAGTGKPDAGAKTTDLEAGGELVSTTTARAFKSEGSFGGGSATPAGKGATVVATPIPDGKQGQAQAVPARTAIRSAAVAVKSATAASAESAASSAGTLFGTLEAQGSGPIKAAAAKAGNPGVKVQGPGMKSGVVGVPAAGTLNKATALLEPTPALTAIGQPGVAVSQTTALDLPGASPSAAQVAAAESGAISATHGVPLGRPDPAQGSATAIKAALDARTESKAESLTENKPAGSAEGPETNAKNSVTKGASTGSSSSNEAAPVAVHIGATQIGLAAVQAIATHEPLAAASGTSSSSARSSVRSVTSVGNGARAIPGQTLTQPTAQASTQGRAPAVTAAEAAASPADTPFVEELRTVNATQQTHGVASGQGVARTGVDPAANVASASTLPASTAATPIVGSATSNGPSADASPGVGVHVASAPISVATGANAGIAAGGGTIATAHAAQGAGVASSPGSAGSNAGSSGAGVVSSALSGVGGAARSDLSIAAEPHRTLVATPTTLEVGVPDGTQGWLRIRAEVGEQGQVNASLAAGSGASQEMLHRELPALNAYLHNEQMAVTATVSERNFTMGGGGGMGGTATQGGTQGGLQAGTQGGTAGGQQADAGQRGVADEGRVQSYNGRAGLTDVAIPNTAGRSYDDESGRWLNVRA